MKPDYELKTCPLCDPVMPVVNGLVWIDGNQLGKRDGHLKLAAKDQHEHFDGADVLRSPSFRV